MLTGLNWLQYFTYYMLHFTFVATFACVGIVFGYNNLLNAQLTLNYNTLWRPKAFFVNFFCSFIRSFIFYHAFRADTSHSLSNIWMRPIRLHNFKSFWTYSSTQPELAPMWASPLVSHKHFRTIEFLLWINFEFIFKKNLFLNSKQGLYWVKMTTFFVEIVIMENNFHEEHFNIKLYSLFSPQRARRNQHETIFKVKLNMNESSIICYFHLNWCSMRS